MTDTPTSATVDPAARKADEFVAALPAAADRAGRPERYAKLGMVVMIIGVVVTIVATIISQASNNPLDQSTQLSLGVAGLALVGLGGAVFLRYSLGQLLRYWLLWMADDRHR